MSSFIRQEELEKVLRVKAIIEKDFKYHFTHQHLAQQVNSNESKLRQSFKQVFGKTINDYLTLVRVEKAKDLLEHSDLPIKMIADRVGYDLRNFNRQFKKVTEVAPLVWRRRNKTSVSQNHHVLITVN